jgi:sugar phosphate isomerase/epimerase
MPHASNRRDFLMGGAALAASAALLETAASGQTTPVRRPASPVRLGIASYSFHEFQRHLALQYTKQLKTTLICLKDVHLPMGSAEEVKRGAAEVARAGLTLAGLGVINFEKSDDDARRKFEYAKAAGAPMIVGSCNPDDVARLERFVREYGIKVAIHNHGPEDKNFPSPFDVLKALEGRDPRLGLCIDLGHSARAGADVVAAIKAAGPKLFDMHIKDLADLSSRESQVIVGEGLMPVPEIFRALIGIGYQGEVNLEYEIDSDNPMPGMQRSFAYMRGVLAGMGYQG